MTKLLIKVGVVLIAIIVLAGLWRLCNKKVGIDQVGVRTNNVTGEIVEKDMRPGFRLEIPGVHRLDILDPTWQFFKMEGSSSLELVGADQYKTTMEVTIVYRIIPGEACKVIVPMGVGDGFKRKMEIYAEKPVWEVLAKLNTSDFYNSEKRMRQADLVVTTLNELLKDENWPLEVSAVLIRNIAFDPNFEARLLEKQLLDQEKLLNVAQENYENELKVTQLIERDTQYLVLEVDQEKERKILNIQATAQAEIDNLNADANKEAETALAEANAFKRQKQAEGELLKTEAQAMGDKAINEAYQGFGGQMYLVKKMIENIEIGNIEINTNKTNPFDVEQMLKMLGAEFTLDKTDK